MGRPASPSRAGGGKGGPFGRSSLRRSLASGPMAWGTCAALVPNGGLNMGRTITLAAVLLATVGTTAGAVVLAGQSGAAPAPPLPAGARAWEYKVLHEFQINQLGKQPAGPPGAAGGRGLLDDGIDSLGADGWELVAVAVTGNAPPRYYFKRPKGRRPPPPRAPSAIYETGRPAGRHTGVGYPRRPGRARPDGEIRSPAR